MSVNTKLIRTQADGTLSFGDYQLDEKTKVSDFEHGGDLYKVKTFKEITKLERNGMFAYESVPGTAVDHFEITDNGVAFEVEGFTDTQITVGVEDDTEYSIAINGQKIDEFETNLSGKVVISVELGEGQKKAAVAIERV